MGYVLMKGQGAKYHLLQLYRCGSNCLGMHRNVGGILETQAGQILDGFGLGGREQHRLALPRQVLNDRIH